jgi:DNA-binding response OmpR family regulator
MKTANVMLIDNDAAVVGQMRSHLAQAGLEAVAAGAGREAIQTFLRRPPDAVILRDTLPEISGWEIGELIREISAVPIIFISDRPDRLSRNRALQIGDDYMPAPWRWEWLVARLSALLKRSSAECPMLPAVYDDGYLRVDLQAQTAVRGGVPLNLTSTEFKLLSCFVRHPNRALGYSEILQSVWGHSYLKAKSDVSLYVRYLRQKIEVDMARPSYLQTVRGFGYLFAGRDGSPAAA